MQLIESKPAGCAAEEGDLRRDRVHGIVGWSVDRTEGGRQAVRKVVRQTTHTGQMAAAGAAGSSDEQQCEQRRLRAAVDIEQQRAGRSGSRWMAANSTEKR